MPEPRSGSGVGRPAHPLTVSGADRKRNLWPYRLWRMGEIRSPGGVSGLEVAEQRRQSPQQSLDARCVCPPLGCLFGRATGHADGATWHGENCWRQLPLAQSRSDRDRPSEKTVCVVQRHELRSRNYDGNVVVEPPSAAMRRFVVSGRGVLGRRWHADRMTGSVLKHNIPSIRA